MSEEQNPFESPQADLRTPMFPERGEAFALAEQIRREYLNHEASVKGIGFLYYFTAFLLAAMVGMVLFTNLFAKLGAMGAIILTGVYAAMALGLGITGYGLRTLASWARIPVTILSGLALLGTCIAIANGGRINGVPIGGAINIYILYLVWSAKGKYVCSDEYHDIIAQTPHIKYKTSIIVKILLWVLLAVLICGGVGLLIPLFTRH